MGWVLISLLGVTVLQTVLCGFSFLLLLSFIGRGIFLLRRIGTVVPYKVSMALEAAHAFLLLVGVIFTKTGVDWVNVILTLLFCGITCLIYLIDDRFYLYVEVDEDAINKEEDEGE